jgi:chemotaxis receptor (MCP) glutamine deamidase CheD
MSVLLDARVEQRLSIGDRNARETCNALEAAHIPVLQLEVGGSLGRRIAFDLTTGAVAVKLIARVS